MRTSLVTVGTLVLVALLGLAGTGLAQAPLAPTSLSAVLAPPSGTDGWNGGRVSATVSLEFCYEAGGANPAGGALIVRAAGSGPSWVQVEVSPPEIEVAPPMGPTAEAACEPAGSFTVTANAPEGVEPGATATVSVAFEVEEQPEENTGVALLGTFVAPGAPAAASFSLTAANAAPAPAGEGDADAAPATPDDQESPAPAAGLLVLGALAVAVARRRRV